MRFRAGMIDPHNSPSFPPDRATLPTSLSFAFEKASISVHFPALKMRILTKKRWISLCLKTCAGIRGFVHLYR